MSKLVFISTPEEFREYMDSGEYELVEPPESYPCILEILEVDEKC